MEHYNIKATKKGQMFEATLTVSDLCEENIDYIILTLIIGDAQWVVKSEESAFRALIELRKKIEPIRLCCFGASRTVYPSPMMESMGGGFRAYKLQIGQKATMDKLVNIFESEDGLDIVSVDEQEEYYKRWLSSLS